MNINKNTVNWLVLIEALLHRVGKQKVAKIRILLENLQNLVTNFFVIIRAAQIN